MELKRLVFRLRDCIFFNPDVAYTGRLHGTFRPWQVAFVLEVADGEVLRSWAKTLRDSVDSLHGEQLPCVSGGGRAVQRAQSELTTELQMFIADYEICSSHT